MIRDSINTCLLLRVTESQLLGHVQVKRFSVQSLELLFDHILCLLRITLDDEFLYFPFYPLNTLECIDLTLCLGFVEK